MIRRLYVDNFRSLVDFTWEPGKECLVLGYNGSGKTSALEALNILMNWVWGWDKFEDVLRLHDRTHWTGDAPITFECELLVQKAVFVYRAAFDFSTLDDSPTVRSESLRKDGVRVFEREASSVSYWVEETRQDFPYPRNGSAIKPIASLVGEGAIREFERAFYEIVFVRPVPSSMADTAEGMPEDILPKMQNFLGWFYYNATLKDGFQAVVESHLKESWEGFDRLLFEKVGREARILKVVFQGISPIGEMAVDFRDLSDGERMLLVLYALVAYQSESDPTTIIIDEPDNYVSLLEIQPWILKMLDTCPDDGQLIVVSHNAEIIQTFGYEHVSYFARKDHTSPTQVKQVEPMTSGFSLDRWLRRGWLDE